MLETDGGIVERDTYVRCKVRGGVGGWGSMVVDHGVTRASVWEAEAWVVGNLWFDTSSVVYDETAVRMARAVVGRTSVEVAMHPLPRRGGAGPRTAVLHYGGGGPILVFTSQEILPNQQSHTSFLRPHMPLVVIRFDIVSLLGKLACYNWFGFVWL